MMCIWERISFPAYFSGPSETEHLPEGTLSFTLSTHFLLRNLEALLCALSSHCTQQFHMQRWLKQLLQCLNDLRDQIVQRCMHLMKSQENTVRMERRNSMKKLAGLQIRKEFSLVDRVRHT